MHPHTVPRARRCAVPAKLAAQSYDYADAFVIAGTDPEAIRQRLARRIGQIEEHINMLARDLAALSDSPLGKLKTMVDEAAAAGKDLVRDMIVRLKRDILVATNRLDALRPPR